MKKYLFIVLLIGVWSCEEEVSQDYIDLEWFYWCGKSEIYDCGHYSSNCEIYKINDDIDTSGTILGERDLSYWFNGGPLGHPSSYNDPEYIRWFEDENLLVFGNYGHEEVSKDIQAYIDAKGDRPVCIWFNEK